MRSRDGIRGCLEARRMGQLEAAATGSLICQLLIFRKFLGLHGSHLLQYIIIIKDFKS